LKHLIILFFVTELLTASMLLGAKNLCIEDFYIKDNYFYYQRSDNNNFYSSEYTTYVSTIIPNFIYDSSTQKCSPNQAYILGMQETEYNFLLGLIGLIFGAVFMFFTTQIFMNVGGKRWDFYTYF